jgi:hypothetical protein
MENLIILGVIILFAALFVYKKQRKESRDESAPTPTPTQPTTDDNKFLKCVGKYDFVDMDDPSKVHFTFILLPRGKVQYQLTNGPVGKYDVNGDNIWMNNVWVETPLRRLEMKVSKKSSDGNWQEMYGVVNGATVRSRRVG